MVPSHGAGRSLLTQAFETASQAAAPAICLPPALEGLPRRPALVLGTGKAAASMAAAFHVHWGAPVRGMVVTRYGHGLKPGEQCGAIEVVEAGHPSPDSASLAAGARLLELARSSRPGETLCCLISGGGSALASQPLPVLTFEQKRAAANFLMRQGADIREINCVRKHLSRLKGGRLAVAAHPATTWERSRRVRPCRTRRRRQKRCASSRSTGTPCCASSRPFCVTRSGRPRSPVTRSSPATACT